MNSLKRFLVLLFYTSGVFVIFMLLTETGFLEYALHKPAHFAVRSLVNPKIQCDWQSFGGGIAQHFWLKNFHLSYHSRDSDPAWVFTANTIQTRNTYIDFFNLLFKHKTSIPLNLSVDQAILTQNIPPDTKPPPPYPVPFQLLNSLYTLQKLNLPSLKKAFVYQELHVQQLTYVNPYTQKNSGTYNASWIFQKPPSSGAEQDLHKIDISADIHGKPLIVTLNGSLHSFQIWGEWDKHPLLLPVQFLITQDKQLAHVDVKWRDWISLTGMGSFQDRLNGHIFGTATKINWSGEYLNPRDVPFPLSLFPRLTHALIQHFIKSSFKSQWKQGLFFINSHLHFASEVIKISINFKTYDEAEFSLQWTDHMTLKGKYSFDSEYLQIDIKVLSLLASHLLYLSLEKPDIELNALIQGDLKINGPLKNLSCKASFQAGKGNYNQFQFQSIILSGEGTGRLFTLDNNCKIVQDNGTLPISGYIDLKQDNIFRNLQVQLVNALDFHNLTFKTSQEGMTIDRKLFKNIDLEVKGSSPNQGDQDQASIGIRIEKKIKF